MAGQTETIIDTILNWIDTGQLMPGDVLDEASLVTNFAVSRTPVREAILTLDAQGLVRRLPRKGAVVFKPNLEEFLAILEVHARLEGQAAGLAARRLSPKGREELETIVASCEAHAKQFGDDQPDQYYQHNLTFHAAVATASGNPFLLDMIKTNARKLMAYYRARYHYAGVVAGSAGEHRDILNAIIARDAEQADSLMQQHVQLDHMTAMDLLAAFG
jgi:DNA-binding GntR family transcriptional regulator